MFAVTALDDKIGIRDLQPSSTTKNIIPVYPVRFFERAGELSYECLGCFITEEKGSTRADDHTFFTAGQHYVRATLVSEEPRCVRANNGDDDMFFFVP
jgi:hypothetical protein